MNDLFPDHSSPVTLQEMIAEVERELALRARVYPKWVAAGRLSQAKADAYTRRLEAVLELLRQQSRANDG